VDPEIIVLKLKKEINASKIYIALPASLLSGLNNAIYSPKSEMRFRNLFQNASATSKYGRPNGQKLI